MRILYLLAMVGALFGQPTMVWADLPTTATSRTSIAEIMTAMTGYLGTHFNPDQIVAAGAKAPMIPYSDALNLARRHEIFGIVIEEDQPPVAFLKTVGGVEYKFFTPNSLIDPAFEGSGAFIEVKPGVVATLTKVLESVQLVFLVTVIGFAIVIGWRYFKSPAKVFRVSKAERTSFDDIAGHEAAKIELLEIAAHIKNRRAISVLGGRVPHGALLVGPPGNGKTMLARALAHESGLPFLYASGSDFLEMFAGLGAARVRRLKSVARRLAKRRGGCIVLLDEIDIVAAARGSSVGGDVKEDRNQILTELLVMVDGFDSKEGIFLLGATNRPEVIDPALLRAKRIERRIDVGLPNFMERTECFTKALVRLKMPVDETFDVSRLAKMTAGMSFADCEGVLNEGAMIAARSNSTCVTMEHASMGRDRVRMGITRTGIVLNEKERRITAYHESGHVLVALMRPNSDPIERVTILPFGRSLGHMMRIPAEDRYMHSVGYLRDLIMVLLAGREAERMIFGEENVTNGAAEDFREATNLSRHMICTAGMDAVIGSVTIEPDQFGRLPDSVAMLVLERTRTMIALLAEEVRQALDGQRETLHKIAESLLSAETLDGDQVREIFSRFGSRDIQAWAASAPSNIS